jgi:hypothetical protein
MVVEHFKETSTLLDLRHKMETTHFVTLSGVILIFFVLVLATFSGVILIFFVLVLATLSGVITISLFFVTYSGVD